jgi:hypothetical protein
MSIPSSGPLNLTTIQTEFGGTNPIGLNEYYAGGAYVPAGTTGTYGAVPSSGAISIRNFYGTANTFIVNSTIASNTTTFNVRNAAIAAGWNQATPLQVNITVNSGVSVNGTGDTTAAAIVASTLPTTTVINLTVNASAIVYGFGGTGGLTPQNGVLSQAGNVSAIGSGGSSPANPYGGTNPAKQGGNGGNGGTAIYIDSALTFNITNSGKICGGGGGGGGNGNNNSGGGSGGNGGVCIVKTTGPVTLSNQSGGVLGGGGGGGAGSGNRSGGYSTGGTIGQPGVITVNSGGNYGGQGTGGASSTANGTTLFNTVGTFLL